MGIFKHPALDNGLRFDAGARVMILQNLGDDLDRLALTNTALAERTIGIQDNTFAHASIGIFRLVKELVAADAFRMIVMMGHCAHLLADFIFELPPI